MDKIPASELIRALQLLLKYNPEVAISAHMEYQSDVVLRGGRYTGHLMTEEDQEEMGRLGWGACPRTEQGNEDKGFWVRYL